MSIAKRISKHNEILLFRERELFATVAGYCQNLLVLFRCTCTLSVSCCVTLQTHIAVFLIWSKPGWKPPSLLVSVNRSFSKTLAQTSGLKLLQTRATFTSLSLFFLKHKIRRMLHCTFRITSLISDSFIVQGRKNYREHDKQCKSHTRAISEFYIMTDVKNSTEIFS